MPEEGGLGAHLTLDLAGQAKFGPDVEWVDSIDYKVNPERAKGFYHTIRRYWPTLPDGALQPSYSGAHAHVALEGLGSSLVRRHHCVAWRPTGRPVTRQPGCVLVFSLCCYIRGRPEQLLSACHVSWFIVMGATLLDL